MNRLTFIPASQEEAWKIVEFWNRMCIGFISHGSNAYAYVIDYDSVYGISNYRALNRQAYGALEDKGRVFKEVPPFIKFPQELQDFMIERGQAHSPIPYVKSKTAGRSSGGFTWSDSDEGQDFWSTVIDDEDFVLFYNHFNLEKDESRLRNKETPFGGDSGQSKVGVRSRFNKARVTVKPLGYQEVLGRG